MLKGIIAYFGVGHFGIFGYELLIIDMVVKNVFPGRSMENRK